MRDIFDSFKKDKRIKPLLLTSLTSKAKILNGCTYIVVQVFCTVERTIIMGGELLVHGRKIIELKGSIPVMRKYMVRLKVAVE